ncbi:MAG: T9SS type A sorting domain-containing protein [Bacteroidota bacterium]
MRLSVLLFLTITCLFSNHSFAQNDPFDSPSICGLNLEIADSSCTALNRFRIKVSGESGQLGQTAFLDEVRLIIAHTWIADLDIHLTSPSGVRVELTTDNGEAEDNYGDPSDVTCGGYISFTTSSCRSIEDIDVPPFIGDYRAEGNLFNFNDGSSPNGQWILEICDDAGDDSGTLEFVELVFSDNSCIAPVDLVVESTDSTTAILDWVSVGNCDNTILEYGLAGFTPGSNAGAGGGTVIVTDCPPFTLLGLAADTDYDIYIRELCNGSNFSPNSCALQLTTACDPPDITLVETFDNQTICPNFCGQPCDIEGIWQNSRNDNFDWTIQSGSTPSENTGPNADVEGDGNYIYIETSGASCRDGNQAILQSSCLEVNAQGVDSCHFSFNYHLFGSSVNQLTLELSNDGGGSWTPIWSAFGNQGDVWQKEYISLVDWDGEIVQLRFVGEGGNGATGDIALDNLIFYGARALGEPSFRFYADMDEDGFGDPNTFIESCINVQPEGFVSNDADCDDTNENINPNGTEIACNGVDENCNGIEDDAIIAAPRTTAASGCSGEAITVTADIPEDGFVLWYGSPDSTDVLIFDNGEGYTLTTETNGDTIRQTVYAEAWQGFDCQSVTRTPTTITIYPAPSIAAVAPPLICPGETVDLSTIDIFDQNDLILTFTYHSDLPDSTNQLTDLIVQPQTDETYYVQAISERGCTDSAPIAVQVGGSADVQITPSDTMTVCAGSLQLLEVDALDTTINYSYVWSTGAVGDSLLIETNETPGILEQYTLTITDENACVTMDTVWLLTSTGITSARVVPEDVTTCGGDNGSVFVEPLSGTPPYSYFWSGTSSGSVQGIEGGYTIPNLEQGTYRITVVDGSDLGCDVQLPFTLVNGPSAKVSLESSEMLSCPESSDGSFCINVEGSAPQILWSNGATTACADSLSAGTYSVTVTDGGCETVLSDLVIRRPMPIQIAASLQSPTCADRADGAIEIIASGGVPPYAYNWSDTTLQSNIRTNLPEGNYQLEIVDLNGCRVNYDIPINAPDSLQITEVNSRDMSCAGLENGFIAPELSGGTAPYFYEWSNGSFESTISDLEANDYELTVTDINGCQLIESFAIAEPEPLNLVIENIFDVSCQGIDDGVISVQATGGSRSYVYQWSNDSQDATTQNLAAGRYFLTVFDENGCRLVDSFDIAAPPTVELTATLQSPTCIGSRDGRIDIQIDNAENLEFEWSSGQLTPNISDVPNGEYDLRIVDVLGCTIDTTFVLDAPQVLDINISTRSPSCPGLNDGSIQLDVVNANGLPPQYRWSNGARTQDIFNIRAGKYMAVISDNDGCTFQTDTIMISEPDSILIELEQLTNLNCANERSASIEVNVSGGRAPYQYDWSNGADSKNIYDLGADTYTLAVLDENGCAAESAPFVVQAPSPILLDFRLVQNEVCQLEGGNVDSLVLMVQGGVPGYQYRWNTSSTDRNLTNLMPGDYSVTVTDRNGCQAFLSSIKVQMPDNGFSIATEKQNVQCSNGADGNIRAMVTGGTAPFIYHLSNGDIQTLDAFEVEFNNLEPSNYDLTITDDNGCRTVARDLFLTQPTPLNIQLGNEGIQNIKCAGEMNGSIDLEISGGIPPYDFEWTNSSGVIVADTLDLINAPADTYTFRFTDANGCSLNPSTYVLREPAFALIFSNIRSTPVQCFGDQTGEIQIQVSGGMPPYQYNWNDGLYMTKNIDSLFAGQYQLEVTDANDCIQFSDSILVRQADAPIQLLEELVDDVRCHDEQNGRIEVLVDGGIEPYQLFWQSPDPDNNYINGNVTTVDDLTEGNYQLSVVDSFSCMATFDFFVGEPLPLRADKRVVDSERDRNNGEAEIIVSGGTAPYNYDWSVENAPDTLKLINLSPGVYFVTISDANDCKLTVAVEIKNDRQNSVDDLSQNATIQLSPNPASGHLQLQLTLPSKDDVQVSLYTSTGQQLWKRWYQNVLDDNWRFEVSDLPSGMYWLHLQTGKSGRVALPLVLSK